MARPARLSFAALGFAILLGSGVTTQSPASKPAGPNDSLLLGPLLRALT